MKPMHLFLALLAVACLGCDSVELTIGVDPGPGDVLLVANATDAEWIDSHLSVEVVESDNSVSPCAERRIGNWRPGKEIEVPACPGKLRFTLTTGGKTARFTYANGQLFRKFGRKEVPVSGS